MSRRVLGWVSEIDTRPDGVLNDRPAKLVPPRSLQAAGQEVPNVRANYTVATAATRGRNLQYRPFARRAEHHEPQQRRREIMATSAPAKSASRRVSSIRGAWI